MKLFFKHDIEKDIWCLLNKGKSSFNSPIPTKIYEQLVSFSKENPDEKDAQLFIEKYILKNEINIEEIIKGYEQEWQEISNEYQKIAERIFGVSLKHDITVYLTVNNRSPYNIDENYFFVSFPTFSSTKTIMHELWHFYTWQKFGKEWQEKLGKQKYNDIKESLTVLLNVECKELFPLFVIDGGYPQHKEMRDTILRIWNEEKDIEKLWNVVVSK